MSAEEIFADDLEMFDVNFFNPKPILLTTMEPEELDEDDKYYEHGNLLSIEIYGREDKEDEFKRLSLYESAGVQTFCDEGLMKEIFGDLEPGEAAKIVHGDWVKWRNAKEEGKGWWYITPYKVAWDYRRT